MRQLRRRSFVTKWENDRGVPREQSFNRLFRGFDVYERLCGRRKMIVLIGKAFDKEKGCGNYIFAGVNVGMERAAKPQNFRRKF